MSLSVLVQPSGKDVHSLDNSWASRRISEELQARFVGRSTSPENYGGAAGVVFPVEMSANGLEHPGELSVLRTEGVDYGNQLADRHALDR